MELLRAEINRKRKATSEITKSQIGKTKYFRQSELIRLQEQDKLEEQRKLDASRAVSTPAAHRVEAVDSVENMSANLSNFQSLTVPEVKARLRALRLPITLFGEDDADRLARLVTSQSEEEEDDYRLTAVGHAMKNPFLGGQGERLQRRRADDDEAQDAALDEEDEKEDAVEKSGSFVRGEIATHFSTTPGLSPEKVIYKYFRNLLKQWEWDLDEREDQLKLTAKGKHTGIFTI
jgi:pre-mRNA-splicing factor 18